MVKSLYRRSAHAPGACGASFAPDGHWVLTCGVDGLVQAHDVRKGGTFKARPLGGDCARLPGALTSIAVAPSGWGFVAGDEDGQVRVFEAPEPPGPDAEVDWGDDDLEVRALPFMVRLGGAVRAIDFSPSGSTFVIGGEEPGVIKMVNRSHWGRHAVFRGGKAEAQDDSIVDLAYDPINDFVLSVGERGSACVWSIDELQSLCTVDLRSATAKVTSASWHPNGSQFALGTAEGITIVARYTWSPLATVQARRDIGSAPALNSVQWCGSGLYVLSGGSDGSVLLVDAEKRTVLDRWKADTGIQRIRWNPTADAFFVVDAQGQVCYMPNAVGEGRAPSYRVEQEAQEPVAAAEEATGVPAEDPPTGDNGSESGDHLLKTPRRRLRRPTAGGEREFTSPLSPEDSDRAESDRGAFSADDGPRADDNDSEAAVDAHRRHHRTSSRTRSGPRRPTMPASTPDGPLVTRRILTWNRCGVAFLYKDDAHQSVEIDYGGPGKIYRFVDHFGVNVGTLNEQGALLSCPKTDDHPSMAFYKAFDSWTASSDWNVALGEDEGAVLVALGDNFAAVVTTRQLVRLFTLTGVQTDVCAIAGPAVTASAAADRLCIATSTHRGPHELSVEAFTVNAAGIAESEYEGPLRVTAGGTIRWLGLLDVVDAPVVLDSAGAFFVLEELGSTWRWTLLAEGFDDESDCTGFWPISADLGGAIGVNLYNESHPGVVPRPLPLKRRFRPPLLETTSVQRTLFEQRRSLRMKRGRVQRAAGGESGDGHGLTGPVEDVQRSTLRAIEEACKSQNPARALELFITLEEPSGLKLAMKVAQHYRMSTLVDRMRITIEAQLLIAGSRGRPGGHDSGRDGRAADAGNAADDPADQPVEEASRPRSLAERFKSRSEHIGGDSRAKRARTVT